MADSVNALSINGLPIAKVSKGEKLSVTGKPRCKVCKALMHGKDHCIHGHAQPGEGRGKSLSAR